MINWFQIRLQISQRSTPVVITTRGWQYCAMPYGITILCFARQKSQLLTLQYNGPVTWRQDEDDPDSPLGTQDRRIIWFPEHPDRELASGNGTLLGGRAERSAADDGNELGGGVVCGCGRCTALALMCWRIDGRKERWWLKRLNVVCRSILTCWAVKYIPLCLIWKFWNISKSNRSSLF